MNIWHDGPAGPPYLHAGNPLAAPPPVALGSTAATPASTRSAAVAARPRRMATMLPTLIKQILAAPTQEEARRVACEGLRALLRCGEVVLRLLDDAPTRTARAGVRTPAWPSIFPPRDTVEAATLRIPVLADHQVIGSLILDWRTKSRPLSPAARAAVEAVAQVLAQRLAHLRLLAASAPVIPPAAHAQPMDDLPWPDALCAAHDGPLLLLDAAGRVWHMNPAMRQWCGREAADALVGASGLDLLDRLERTLEPLGPTDGSGERLPTDTARSQRFVQRVPVRRVLARRDRTVRTADGARWGTVVVFRDITAEYDAEKRREQLLAAVAHGLRTPLTSVCGNAQLLLRELDRVAGAPGSDPAAHARARGQLGALVRQAARMNSLLRDMLDASRLAALGRASRSGAVDLAALVAEVTEAARATSPRHAILLRAPGVLPPVRGDGADITRIVRHLLENAIAFSPAGGAIWLTLRREHSPIGVVTCVLRVRDHGIGIPAGMEEAIFAPSARRDIAGTRPLTGIGLGLPLSRALAARHGGTLHAVPGRQAGAIFELRLPVAHADDRAPPTVPADP